jgi:hypothetical protein
MYSIEMYSVQAPNSFAALHNAQKPHAARAAFAQPSSNFILWMEVQNTCTKNNQPWKRLELRTGVLTMGIRVYHAENNPAAARVQKKAR